MPFRSPGRLVACRADRTQNDAVASSALACRSRLSRSTSILALQQRSPLADDNPVIRDVCSGVRVLAAAESFIAVARGIRKPALPEKLPFCWWG